MKPVFVVLLTALTIFIILLLAGCASSEANDDNALLDAYLPWQIEAAKSSGVTEDMLREHADYFLGSLEKWNSNLNSTIPIQSALDEALLDALSKPSEHFMFLRSEMAVLLTKQQSDIYYSIILDAGTEGEEIFIVAWSDIGEEIRIIDRKGAFYPQSTVIHPTVTEVAGESLIFGIILNDHWYGDSERYPVKSGTFTVVMENGVEITQDVANMPGFLVFLQNSDYLYWSLTDTQGVLLWDSDESTWRG